MKKNNTVKDMNSGNSGRKQVKIFSLLSIFISSLYIAHALTISPARIELAADPGTTITDEFTIINEQDSEQTYYTSVENFEAQGESGTPSFSKNKEGLASWVEVVEKVTIQKGEKIKIPFTVRVPAGSDPGGHFAAIFLSTIPPATGAGEVSVGAKVGMLMLLKVNGNIKEEGGVLSFSLKGCAKENKTEGKVEDNFMCKHFVTALPVDFVYRFNNNGNDRVKPMGTTTIRNMFWMKTEELNANPNEGNVLPSSVRRFELKWGNEEPLPASASFGSHVSYQMRNFALGLYFVNLDLTFGTKTASNSLWLAVLPWHLLVVIFLILGVVFLMLRLILKKYNNFIIAQARLMNANASSETGEVVRKPRTTKGVKNKTK